MKCKEVEKKLVFFTESELPQQTQLEIEAHLKSCVKCAQLAEKFSKIYSDLENTEEIQPTPFFWTRLKQRIAEYEASADSTTEWLNILIERLRPAIVIVILIVGIFLGYWLGNFPVSNNQINEQEVALEQFFDFQVGNLPSDSIEEFYLSLYLEF